MNIEFNKVSEFNRGTIFELLADAYSFDYRCAQRWSSDWKEFDNFFLTICKLQTNMVLSQH